MKKVLIGLMIMGVIASNASSKVLNFDSFSDWLADKDATHYQAVVDTSEVKDGYNIGTAEIVEEGEFYGKIVKFTQKPFFASTTPFVSGAIIWVVPYDNKQ